MGRKDLITIKLGQDLSVPDAFDVMGMVAIGRPAPKEILPPEVRQERTPI